MEVSENSGIDIVNDTTPKKDDEGGPVMTTAEYTDFTGIFEFTSIGFEEDDEWVTGQSNASKK